MQSYFITELTKVLDKRRSNLENIVVLGDLIWKQLIKECELEII